MPYRPIAIGSLAIPGNLFLAPVAGYSDRAYRSLCLEYGADMAYTEMVAVEALVRDHRKTMELASPAKNETILAIQLFGANPESFALAVEKILPLKPSLIDVNCGCPVPKVVKSGAGSALMKDTGRIRAIVQAASGASSVPVTVKIRTGWDSDHINFLEAAAAAVEGGAKAVALHARTREQGYSGLADWDSIRILKENLAVPVIGSGDLFLASDAVSMMEKTGCDAVMFARGALGNPFIFREARRLIENPDSADAAYRPPFEEIIQAARRHFELSLEYSGEVLTCMEMKKHLCSYFKGFPRAAEFRNAIVTAKTVADYEKFLRLEYMPPVP